MSCRYGHVFVLLNAANFNLILFICYRTSQENCQVFSNKHIPPHLDCLWSYSERKNLETVQIGLSRLTKYFLLNKWKCSLNDLHWVYIFVTHYIISIMLCIFSINDFSFIYLMCSVFILKFNGYSSIVCLWLNCLVTFIIHFYYISKHILYSILFSI